MLATGATALYAGDALDGGTPYQSAYLDDLIGDGILYGIAV